MIAEVQRCEPQDGNAEALVPVEQKDKLCQLCRRVCSPDEPGRAKVATFSCRTCLTLQTCLYRNVGPASMKDFSMEERRDFYVKCGESPLDSRYKWTTIRSVLLTKMISRHMTETAIEVTAESLPLKVWTTRGWDEEAVKACPSTEDTKLGTLYAVPTRKDVWREVHQKMEERISELEKELEAKKQKKRKARDMDGGNEEAESPELEVAERPATGSRQPATGKSAREPAAKAAKAEAKPNKNAAPSTAQIARQNQKTGDLAAKAVSILAPVVKGLTGLQKPVQDLALDHELAKKLADGREEAQGWFGKSTDMLQLVEPAKVSGVPLPALPFNHQDLKVRQKVWAELLKEGRTAVKDKKEELKSRKKEEATHTDPAVMAPPISSGPPSRRRMGKQTDK